jgi:hypothetical protein
MFRIASESSDLSGIASIGYQKAAVSGRLEFESMGRVSSMKPMCERISASREIF